MLFLDIVAYSRLPMEEQEQALRRLQETVSQTKEFERARESRRLISLPTGDGMALVFFQEVEAPLRCAIELSRALHAQPGLELRMGIHSGPVYRVDDINANRNVAGGGINIAQRVMDCGDAGHILVSKSVADTLSHFSAWQGTLHDLGEVEVKHGVRVHLFSFRRDEVGNQELPKKLLGIRQASERAKRKKLALGLTVVGFVFALVASFLYWRRVQALTEKDAIVLADFTNTTGEEVFNDALKGGLSAELEQSTFLNILSDEKVNQQLRYMGRPAGERLTPAVAREVCRRESSKAVLWGAVSNLGSHYVITLKAQNCRTGESLGVEQAEAASKEDVLVQLGQAGSRLRSKLGESLASVQKYDTPLEQATTSSLEALQAYSVALKTWRSQGDMAAVPLLKRAIELDSNFALAHASLAVMYSNLSEPALSAQSAKRAFELRDRVTERERFAIDWNYYQSVTEELDKMAETNEERKQIYPRDLASYVNLGLVASLLGQLDQALANDLNGLQLGSDQSVVYRNLSFDYMSLDRLDEAKAILDQARARQLDDSLLPNYYQVAFLRDDAKEMDRCVSAAAGKSGFEDQLLSSQSDTEAFHGRLEKARLYSRMAVDSALAAGAKETAASWQGNAALREAEFGNAAEAKHQAAAALAIASNGDVQVAAAMAFARAGELTRAQTMVDELRKNYPKSTLLNKYWLPSIRAAITISRSDPPLAIGFLEVTAPYELGGMPPPFTSGATLYPAYLRGEAYLRMRRWSDAAAEFRKISDHRGLVWNFPLGVLAHLQLGRAYAGTGDTAKARKEYIEFLSLWRHADPNIPVLRDAKVEYEKLK